MTGFVMMRATAAACLGALLAAAPLSPVAERGVAIPSAAAKGGGGGGSEHGGGHGGGAGGGGSGSGGGQGAGRGGEHATSGATSGGTAQNGHGGRQSGGGSHDGRHAGGWGHDGREMSIAGRAGALNATHASAMARGHAAPNSRVGQIATYDRSMSRALAMPTATPAQRAAQREAIAAARGQLAAAGNKPLSPTVIGWVDDRFGLAPTSHGQGGR